MTSKLYILLTLMIMVVILALIVRQATEGQMEARQGLESLTEHLRGSYD